MSQGAIVEPSIARAMSLEEWAAMPDDEPGKLVNGQLIEEEAADIPHEVIVSPKTSDLPVMRTWRLDTSAFAL